MAKTSRQIALETLTEIERKACFADDFLARHLSKASHLNTKERALVMELVKGTLRWLKQVDYFLDQLCTRPLESIPSRIRNVLRLGAYQVLFLDRIPDWAAVDQASELARHYGHEGHVKFVNGILRNLIRKRESLSFPEASERTAHLAVLHSFPEWLVERWVARFGQERAGHLMEACNKPPRICLRVNTLKTSRDELADRLVPEVASVTKHPLVSQGLEVTGAGDITRLPGYAEGWFYVQDAGAMAVSSLVGAKSGERILDACAAPGGKATHLAELMGDDGEIAALEVDRQKIKRIRENTARLGIQTVRPQTGDAWTIQFEKPFDRILIDAPCSALGTLRRHPEAKWQKKEEDILRHSESQFRILKNISRALKTGGTLVYATCSTEPEENENVIKRFLGESPEFEIQRKPAHVSGALEQMFDDQGFFYLFPDLHGTDGFCAACLVKKAPS